MINPNVEQLESLISAVVNNLYKEVPPTEDEFLEKATLLRNTNAPIMPVSDDEFAEIISRLKQSLVIQMDVGVYINDRNNGHQSWLPSKRADFDFFFWNRYKKYLEEIKHWNPRVTTNLGKVSDEILDLCGDPSEDHFAIKGLVLGDVQSGKTANYTAICNKAADTGYRIIIVLAGMQENLRKQTQERLDAECTGRKSEYYLDPKAEQGIKNQPVGVGRYGTDKKIVAFTSVTKDFDSGILRNNNLGIENVNCPVILVVKKNKRILNNLIKWLSDNNTQNAAGQIDLPLMLIDDEADNASVNTKDEDSQPAAINDCIRRLLNLFSKTTYLGITATPFANIFIDPEKDDDLFPADFIYALSAPTNYIGADRIFGENSDSDHMLQEIDIEELEACFPPKHKKDFVVEDLPEDLYEAAYYFLLLNAIRDYRGDLTEHRSMMVHISLYTNVQNQIQEMLNVWLDQVKSDVRNYAKLPLSQSEKIRNIKAMHVVWDKYHLSGIVGIEWENLLKNYLHKAISPIEVRAVNMKTGAASLDYFNHKNIGDRFFDEERTRGHYYWKNVPGDNIAQLLLDFETNPWHLSFNGRALAEFIESHHWSNGWDVVLIKSGTGIPYDEPLQCGEEILEIEGTEKRKILADKKMISVSGTKLRVGAGGCTRIGLTKKEIQDAEEAYRNIPGNANKKNIPDKAYLIANRDPILMLHIIQADYSKSENKDLPEFLFALGVGFPKTSGSTETANYKVNLIELRNWVDVYDNYDDDEDM